ncbi:hypothetical protein Tco_0907889 [Tanacetum coccineum]|uniref:Integrase, catalytic region, zinc finger, CCHC-type, peptidase aspartic, catalytic n=1 Tax=Tanacetum coccineum TaxID=301880 RepID=A0ABQ5CRY9_9ASTR
MTLDIHNWLSIAHQELHKIIKYEIFHIVNQVVARVQNFKIQFLKEAAKFVQDFKSLAKEADESLAMHKALEYEIERLLRAIFNQDIMSIVQSNSVIDTSNLHTELEVDNISKTKRPQPRSNTKNNRVPSASKSYCIKTKYVEVEEHHRNLLLSKNKKHMSSGCNNIKLAIRNDKSKVVCAMCRSNLFMMHRLGMLKAYDRKYEAFYKFCLKVSGNGHNLFLVGQFYDSDIEVAFRRNTCFIRNLEGVDLLKGNRTTNLYTINLHEMAFASLIFLMARATSTKSWL